MAWHIACDALLDLREACFRRQMLNSQLLSTQLPPRRIYESDASARCRQASCAGRPPRNTPLVVNVNLFSLSARFILACSSALRANCGARWRSRVTPPPTKNIVENEPFKEPCHVLQLGDHIEMQTCNRAKPSFDVRRRAVPKDLLQFGLGALGVSSCCSQCVVRGFHLLDNRTRISFIVALIMLPDIPKPP